MSELGNDFRPDYGKLSTLKDDFPGIQILCLTATATAEVRYDVIESLRLKDALYFSTMLGRSNLRYSVKKLGVSAKQPEQLKMLRECLIKFKNSSGIIYCSKKSTVTEVAEAICNAGWTVL